MRPIPSLSAFSRLLLSFFPANWGHTTGRASLGVPCLLPGACFGMGRCHSTRRALTGDRHATGEIDLDGRVSLSPFSCELGTYDWRDQPRRAMSAARRVPSRLQPTWHAPGSYEGSTCDRRDRPRRTRVFVPFFLRTEDMRLEGSTSTCHVCCPACAVAWAAALARAGLLREIDMRLAGSASTCAGSRWFSVSSVQGAVGSVTCTHVTLPGRGWVFLCYLVGLCARCGRQCDVYSRHTAGVWVVVVVLLW